MLISFSIMKLSILIPIYKDNVVRQVALLQGQCKALEAEGLEWEIVVADDGSPQHLFDVNAPVADMDGCRLLRRERNGGRASNRNFLARNARYPWLLYQDAEALPGDSLVRRFVECAGRADVVCGSFGVPEAEARGGKLRCMYELQTQRRLTAATRNRKPYGCFHINNFMIRREVLLGHPFDESMTGYGYEDVVFGKHLEQARVGVFHIDNPVAYQGFEDNMAFIAKVGESVGTLYRYRDELHGYSALLGLVEKMKRCRLLWLSHLFMMAFSRLIVSNLSGRNPSLFLFNVYRVGLLADKFYAD